MDKIYPITIKLKFLAPIRLGFWTYFGMIFWIVAWGVYAVNAYKQGKINSWFYVALTLTFLGIVGLIYVLKGIKPLVSIDDQQVRVIFGKYNGTNILLDNIEKVELKSGRGDYSDGPNHYGIFFNNYLLIYLKNDREKVIKLPLGITRYYAGLSGFFDQKRMKNIKRKLLKYNINLVNFDLSIESQNKDYKKDLE